MEDFYIHQLMIHIVSSSVGMWPISIGTGWVVGFESNVQT